MHRMCRCCGATIGPGRWDTQPSRLGSDVCWICDRFGSSKGQFDQPDSSGVTGLIESGREDSRAGQSTSARGLAESAERETAGADSISAPAKNQTP